MFKEVWPEGEVPLLSADPHKTWVIEERRPSRRKGGSRVPGGYVTLAEWVYDVDFFMLSERQLGVAAKIISRRITETPDDILSVLQRERELSIGRMYFAEPVLRRGE